MTAIPVARRAPGAYPSPRRGRPSLFPGSLEPCARRFVSSGGGPRRRLFSSSLSCHVRFLVLPSSLVRFAAPVTCKEIGSTSTQHCAVSCVSRFCRFFFLFLVNIASTSPRLATASLLLSSLCVGSGAGLGRLFARGEGLSGARSTLFVAVASCLFLLGWFLTLVKYVECSRASSFHMATTTPLSAPVLRILAAASTAFIVALPALESMWTYLSGLCLRSAVQ